MKKYLILNIIIILSGCKTLFFDPLPLNTKIDKIIVFKSKRLLVLYYKNSKIKEYKISLGKNPGGPKTQEGDYKTPEGNYFIDGKSKKTKWYCKLYISYPNIEDIKKAKKSGINPGSNILIHGMQLKYSWLGKLHLLRDWTQGCIAMTNYEMNELYKFIKIGTPIKILK